MGLRVAQGSFAQPTSTGQQTVSLTGLGLSGDTPQFVLFCVTNRTSDGSSAHVQLGRGAMTASTQAYCANGAQDLVTAFAGTRGWSSSKCIGIYSPSAATVLAEAGYVSFAADAFTIDWTTVDATARIVTFLAFSGLTGAFIGNKAFSSTGSDATTGVGFQSDAILFIGPGVNITSGTIEGATNVRVLHGMAVSATQRGTSNAGFSGGDRRSISYQRTTRAAASTAGIAAAPQGVAELDLTSMDSDGFTVNKLVAAGSQRWIYICLKGVRAEIGSFNQATATGQQTVTLAAATLTPLALLLQSVGVVTDADGNNPGALSLGMGTSASVRSCVHISADDNAAVLTAASQNLDRAKILKTFTALGATPTLTTAMDLVSLGAGQFIVDNTTVDATAREILYLAIGSPISITRQMLQHSH